MIHSKDAVLDWLRDHCQHDRVLYNALNNHSNGPTLRYARTYNQWFVTVTSRSHSVYMVAVLLDPVTGDPCKFYRVRDGD